MRKCNRCKTDVPDEYYICDSCRIKQIEKRIEENTSYVWHLDDLKFLMNKYKEVQSLLTSHGPEGHQYSNAAYVEILQESHSRKLKLDVLTDALKFYADKPCIQENEIGWNVGYIARKKLKEAESIV